MTQPAIIKRPELTLPKVEAELLRAEYSAAKVILEYGSGGSTVMAAEMVGKVVFSVESSRDWAQMMRGYFKQNLPVSEIDIIWSDIGETKEWGHPVNNTDWRRYAAYPLQVWHLPEFQQPDVVLVDGRFRVGCALASSFLSHAPLVLLVDDYSERDNYHVIEDYIGRPEMQGRMARFEVTPQPLPPERLLQVVNLMSIAA